MECLPVVVRKGRSQIDDIAADCYGQRQLCPTVRLVAALDEKKGTILVRYLGGTHAHCQLDSHKFTGFVWLSGAVSEGGVTTSGESLLLTVTTAQDLILFSVSHENTLSVGEGARETVLLFPRVVATMGKPELTRTLSRTQLGSTVDSLQIISSFNMEALLLINEIALLRILADPSNQRLSISSLFSIEPNMDECKDHLLPEYVGSVTAVHCQWPLLFCLTEDGIVLIHHVLSTHFVGAVNVVEYCRQLSPQHSGSEETFKSFNSVRFSHVAASSSLTHLVVAATDSPHLLVINMADYYHLFPTHYSKKYSSSTPRGRRKHHTRSAAVIHNKILQEEEEDRLQYGGLTRRQLALGQNYLGPFAGDVAWQSRFGHIKKATGSIDPSRGKGFTCSSSLKMSGSTSNATYPKKERKWYEPPHQQSQSSLSHTYESPCISTFKKASYLATSAGLPTSSSLPLSGDRFSYTSTCVLPSPASHVTQDCRTLLHIDCGSDIVVAYYGTQTEAQTSGTGVKSTLPQGMVTVIGVYHIKQLTCSIVKFSRPNWLILPSESDQPIFLVTDSSLSVASFSLSQEDFVAKALVYGSASSAEEMCYLNRWDKCSLPLTALETALELRQLDIVSFFLRNKDPMEHSHKQHKQRAPGEEQRTAPPPPLPPSQLDKAVEILTSSIKRNHGNKHNQQFAGQLLGMTVNFLLRQLKAQMYREEGRTSPNLCDSFEEDGTREPVRRRLTSELSDTGSTGGQNGTEPISFISPSGLTCHIHSLRDFFPGGGDKGKVEGEEKKKGKERREERVLPIEDWQHLSSREVVWKALLSGNLPSAQAYLMQRAAEGGEQDLVMNAQPETVDSGNDTDHGDRGSTASRRRVPGRVTQGVTLDGLVSVCVGFVMESLSSKNMKQAVTILGQMGADVRQSLRFIFLHTVQREIRNLLANELSTRGWLDPRESEALEYLHILEKCYPLQSFEQAKSLQQNSKAGHGSFPTTPSFSVPLTPGFRVALYLSTTGELTESYPETFGGDIPLEWRSASSAVPDLMEQQSLYIQVPVYVVLDWDYTTKQRVLFEALVLSSSSEESSYNQLVPADQQLRYHLHHSDVGGVLTCLPLLSLSSTQQLVSSLPPTLHYITEVLLDELARQGVFCTVNEANMTDLLYRLGRVHTLFTIPHPLQSSSDCSSQVQQFHRTFISYTIKHDFINLLYLYLDFYKLALDGSSIEVLGLSSSSLPPWVDLMLHCRLAAYNPNEPTRVFAASLSCSRLLTKCNSVNEMLSSNHVFMALAMLMYAPVPMEEAMNVVNEGSPYYVDLDQLRQSLAPYPTLQAAVFPSPPSRSTPAESQDVTLYELLKNNVPFDVTRLFLWQHTNNVGVVDDDTDAAKEPPHFSQPSLSQLHAPTEQLNYHYYFSRGQPSFAFANFVASKLVNTTNANKRIDRAVSKVYSLALSDFTNSKLVASCVAFLEMLGRDSTGLRVDTQSAQRILSSLINQESKGEETATEMMTAKIQKRKIVSQFVQLHTTADSSLALHLLGKLEKATQQLLAENEVESCCMEGEISWSLVQSFCSCHNLPPSTAFIIECAKKAKWPPLLCHAQLYQIPTQEVLHVIDKHYSDEITKEHLHLAISTMDSAAMPPLPPTKKEDNKRVRSKKKRVSEASLEEREGGGSLIQPKRDIRGTFYSKVGLHMSPQGPLVAVQPALPSSPPPITSDVAASIAAAVAAREDQPQELPSPIMAPNLPNDLFSVLFKCQDHAQPWRALLAHAIPLQHSLLPLLAASYKDASLVSCMCVWLATTIGCKALIKISTLLNLHSDTEEGLMFLPELQWRQWTQEDLAVLLLAGLLEQPCPAAQFPLLFMYFDKHNPLLSLMRFHEDFLLRCDIDQCRAHLSEFELSMDKCTVMAYPGLIGNRSWAEEIATTFANHMIATCPTPFERAKLLKLLAETRFGHNFHCQIPKFSQLYKISAILDKAGLSSVPVFKVTDKFSPSPGANSILEMYVISVAVEIDHIVGVLVEKGQYAAAREYAEIAGLPVSEVTLKEVENKYCKYLNTSYWQYQPARISFWLKSYQELMNDSVDPLAAAEFFEGVVWGDPERDGGSSVSPSERTLLLVFALLWRRRIEECSAEDISRFEREIWSAHIHAINQQPTKETTSISALYEDLLSSGNFTSSCTDLLKALTISSSPIYRGHCQLKQLILNDTVPVAMSHKNDSDLSDKEAEVLELFIGRLLNAGWVPQARELAASLQHNSPDLTIVLCFIQLAQGKLTPDQLTEDVLSLLSVRSRHHLVDPSLSLDGGGVGGGKMASEIIRMMQQLSDRAQHAQQCCQCILSCFKIALALKKSYTAVTNSDPFDTLADLLSSLHADKYVLARSFILSTNIQPREIAGFLSDCIAASLQSYVGGVERDYSRVKVYQPLMTTNQFMDLAQLCTDHSVLASHLLSMGKSMAGAENPTEISLSMQVEMLIRSHDCYTLACSVDGIAEVLRVARDITVALYKGRHYKLMVRLLTGVGRFHEMGYIIKLLLECDEFESLVHPGVEKAEQLRVALMDYLKKHWRHDAEKMQMVALKFGMYRELAKTREDHATKDMRRVKHINNNSETVHLLKRIFSDFRDAAKIYSQNNCLSSAEHCLAQARLVALQLSLLQPPVKQVINLDIKAVHCFMEEQPFLEALVVADAYKQSMLADWVTPLYHRVIIKGDMKYLNEFKSVFPLAPATLQELASRYMLDRNRPNEAAANMQRLLLHSTSFSLQHKIAQQLGLKESAVHHSTPTFNEGFYKDVARL